MSTLGEHSIFSCPDCGGGLWQITENNIQRYRCHIGHAYTEADLSQKQAEMMEGTLWVALRIMEERRNLSLKISDNYRKKGLSRLAAEQEQKATAVKVHIDRLKEILFAVQAV